MGSPYATRYSLLAIVASALLTLYPDTAAAQLEPQPAGPALGNCQFICETFSRVEDFSGNTLPDGGAYTVDFVTTPLGFRYSPGAGNYDLDTISNWLGTNVYWGRFFSPETNLNVSYLDFPPGIAVGIAILQVRSQGGGDWDVYPVQGTTRVGQAGLVMGGDNQRRTMIMCGDDFFTGLEFESPNQNSEPAVFEVCIPQDPEACFATED